MYRQLFPRKQAGKQRGGRMSPSARSVVLPLCAERARIASHWWHALAERPSCSWMSHHLDARCSNLGLTVTEAFKHGKIALESRENYVTPKYLTTSDAENTQGS